MRISRRTGTFLSLAFLLLAVGVPLGSFLREPFHRLFPEGG
jgi:hypothetical protein